MPLKGYSQSEEHKKSKVKSLFVKGHKPYVRMGDKNGRWLGGLSFFPYTNDWTSVLRESIRQRDEFICFICGMHQDELVCLVKQLDVHHIDYDKTNCSPQNLISLCRHCHMTTNVDRSFWINFFKESLK